MDKQQMEQQFLSRYDSIIRSGDTRQMERLGAMVKRVMGWMFKYEPQVAAQALALLDDNTATDYANRLTEQEAKNIVAQMVPQPAWTMQGLTASLQSMGLPGDASPLQPLGTAYDDAHDSERRGRVAERCHPRQRPRRAAAQAGV